MVKLNLVPGHTVRFYETLDSTNEEGLRLIRKGQGQDGLWIVAETQTKGRGRLGRAWVSEKGNLFATHLIRLKIPMNHASELSFVAALAVFHAINDVLKGRVTLSFKWPNDVLLDRKKVAGILVESESGPENWVVIGFGINIENVPKNVSWPATFLQEKINKKINKNILLEKLSKAWGTALLNLYQENGFAMTRKLWLMSAEGLGQHMRVRVGDEELCGVFEGLGARGELVLKLPNGAKKAIISGEILEMHA